MSITTKKKKTNKQKVKLSKVQSNGHGLLKAVPLRIDFGCGQNCLVGEDGVKFTGVDQMQLQGVDIVHDLTHFPYPFETGSVDEIFANHFVEHLTGEDFIKFMDECHRILRLGAKMRLIHPYCFSARAFQDPTHKTFIPAERYMYFDKNWRAANKLDHYQIHSDFEYLVMISFHGDKGENWMLKQEQVRSFAQSHYVNVVADLIVDLKKR